MRKKPRLQPSRFCPDAEDKAIIAQLRKIYGCRSDEDAIRLALRIVARYNSGYPYTDISAAKARVTYSSRVY